MNPGIPRTTKFPRHLAIAASFLLTFTATPAAAQWLNYKPPGILRTADGKPDLTAPAPKMPDGKPDLSGNWRSDAAGFAETSRAQDTVKLQPWAVALTEPFSGSPVRSAVSFRLCTDPC